jgi:hypothetical protein
VTSSLGKRERRVTLQHVVRRRPQERSSGPRGLGIRNDSVDGRTHRFPVVISRRSHPIPSRTRKLSSLEPMVLLGQPSGRVGRCRGYFESLHDSSCRLFFWPAFWAQRARRAFLAWFLSSGPLPSPGLAAVQFRWLRHAKLTRSKLRSWPYAKRSQHAAAPQWPDEGPAGKGDRASAAASENAGASTNRGRSPRELPY